MLIRALQRNLWILLGIFTEMMFERKREEEG